MRLEASEIRSNDRNYLRGRRPNQHRKCWPDHRTGGNILEYNRVGSDPASVADHDRAVELCAGSQVAVVADRRGTAVALSQHNAWVHDTTSTDKGRRVHGNCAPMSQDQAWSEGVHWDRVAEAQPSHANKAPQELGPNSARTRSPTIVRPLSRTQPVGPHHGGLCERSSTGRSLQKGLPVLTYPMSHLWPAVDHHPSLDSVGPMLRCGSLDCWQLLLSRISDSDQGNYRR